QLKTCGRQHHLVVARTPCSTTSSSVALVSSVNVVAGLIPLGGGARTYRDPRSLGRCSPRSVPLVEAADSTRGEDAAAQGAGASRPWMACVRLLEPGRRSQAMR